MIIICINLRRCTERRDKMIQLWSHLGQFVILPAVEADSTIGMGKLTPGEVACIQSHNRALRLIQEIGKTCAVIEDDAVPMKEFQWPDWTGRGRLQLEWHGNNGSRWGTVAALVHPECPEMSFDSPADHWPAGYPVEYLDKPIVLHGKPGETTIHGRPKHFKKEI